MQNKFFNLIYINKIGVCKSLFADHVQRLSQFMLAFFVKSTPNFKS